MTHSLSDEFAQTNIIIPGLLLIFCVFIVTQATATQVEKSGNSSSLISPQSASWVLGVSRNNSFKRSEIYDLESYSSSDRENKKVIVGFKGEPNVSLFRSYGGKVEHVFNIIPALAGRVPEQKISSLREKSKVNYVEPDRKIVTLGENLPWGIDRIDADEVWNKNDDSAYDGSGVKLAILDTGIDWDHPDLKGNCGDENLGENGYGYDFVNDDNNPMDDEGHGTGCAGIAAAVNNGTGVIGANPDASLYGVKVLGSDGTGNTSDLIEGIEWSVNNGMDIISMSLGSDNQSILLEIACDEAYNEGLLLVAAAGNDGENSVDYPAKYDSVIAVGATNEENTKWSSSNYGSNLELTAPGTGIYTTYWGDTYDYAYLTGTSASCPHVSGTAALVWANYPDFTNEQVRKRLDNTAEDLGPAGCDEKYGYGLVDARAATGGIVRSVSVDISPPENSALPGENLNFTVTVTNDGNVTDNYKIENVDSQGWKMSLSQTRVSINPGSSTDVSLQVAIPSDATGGTEDNITVIATSKENSKISAENSCLASVTTVQDVDASVSPSADNAPPGYTLSYEVTVTNTGNLSDSYDLSVVDNAEPGWSPSLNDNLFESVAPGESRTTILEVTIRENADMGVEDNITTTATSQENTSVSDNTSCIALSVALVRGVKVTVSPGLKDGYLGSTLEYSVTIKNEGNVPDNYELNASDDVDPSWNPSFADNLMENVASGEEKTAMLSVKIPDNDNLIGTTDNITVTATSQENTPVSDNEICHAEAVEPPVGGVFHPADRESLQEQGRGTLTAFVVSLVTLITALIFAVWWERE